MNKPFAFVFPGQGSQSVGMLQDVAAQYSLIQEVFDEASDLLSYDLWQLVNNGPEEKLNKTEYTQPALLTASVALYRLWLTQGGEKPQVMAGHSLGEYSALVCANALAFQDAVTLVAKRGQLMQNAAPAGIGAMAAIIGLTPEEVVAVCEKAVDHECVSAANFNSPQQTVIAGHASAVERALDFAKEAGAKIAKKLPVSVPSHCLLMKPAADELKSTLKTIAIQTPEIDVINNVDATAYQEAEAISDALVRQLYSPVRWVETIAKIASLDIDTFIECGPGKVLTGLNKRCLRTANCSTLNTAEDFLKHTQAHSDAAI